ncbi:MAG: sugar-binding transcriptional regulator [Rhodospirillales bacterium]
MKKRKQRSVSSNVDAALATRICWYHFHEGQTQQEVGDRLGLNRATVNKVINDARRNGSVRITVDTAAAPCVELETRLKEIFALRDVVVIPAPADEEDVRRVVGLAAGQYLSRALEPGQTLGIGWGATIHAAGLTLIPRSSSGQIVVSLSGGLPESGTINPYDNAATFARLLSAKCFYMTAPMIAETAELKDALVKSGPVRRIHDMTKKVDIALLSVVDLTAKTRMIDYGVLSRDEIRSLKAAGAVGNICDHYLDAHGRLIDHDINARTISIAPDAIARIPYVILAAGGRFKAEMVRATLRAGLAHALITDEAGANALIKMGA